MNISLFDGSKLEGWDTVNVADWDGKCENQIFISQKNLFQDKPSCAKVAPYITVQPAMARPREKHSHLTLAP